MEKTPREILELQAVLDSMADGVMVMDAGRRIRRWNRAMERLTGYTAAEALGQSCAFLRHDRPQIEGRILGFIDCGAAIEGRVEGEEVFVRRKDGVEAPLLVSARVLRDERGETVGSVTTFTDLSRLRELQRENRLLREEAREIAAFHNIVGRGARMREVFRLIELAAASEETVLILGETGAGKELVARATHHHSARKDGPLVTVNCTALSEPLLESELFGHVRGAFTGAIHDKVGRFESAHGGTLFLDEVGEMPPVIQVKLLRVLQERTIERVGESLTRRVDVRVIAATHRDLTALAREGLFREDLYYRLKVFPIHLPPLRERKEDIGPLTEHFVRLFRERTGKAITGLTPDAMRMVMDHAWPGNVRELENAIAHGFVTCAGGLIGPFDLPVELRRAGVCAAEPENARRAAYEGPARRGKVTRDVLVQALEATGWNKAEAARRLGMDRTSVWRHMKALGVPLRPEPP
ncbi:MAG: sigma 54-interacting transcriptional regulator [Candidatus Hydrogenedentes bacterium]|nr:sigma 54-interacting transcriptional regulator [Candidatus Hydrogenedentota bacterium]